MKLSQLRTYIKEEIKNLKQEADENELMKKLTIEPIKGAGGRKTKVVGTGCPCNSPGPGQDDTFILVLDPSCCGDRGSAMRSGNQTTLGPEGGGRGPGLYDINKRSKGF